MSNRSAYLQTLLDSIEGAIRARADQAPDAMPMVDRIFSALRAEAGEEGPKEHTRLPACRYLDAALANARKGPVEVGAVADALDAVAHRIAWYSRAGNNGESDAFREGHANVHLVGGQGLERRNDVWIGASLMAPGLRYPRHRHPPEEIYVTLSRGTWMRDDIDLPPSQPGDLIHNPPDVWHAMHAMPDAPLLAVWCLWTGTTRAR